MSRAGSMCNVKILSWTYRNGRETAKSEDPVLLTTHTLQHSANYVSFLHNEIELRCKSIKKYDIAKKIQALDRFVT